MKDHPGATPRKWLRNPARIFMGPAERSDPSLPVVHRHDEFEQASEADLAGFEVEEDSTGHHYAVRREHPPARPPEPITKYTDYTGKKVLHTED
ncbi:hypothetical protein [Arthrobacter sp. CAN_A1]|uniref:hypothetical protein n=1 Tax=Arthrobacter sp. CAN_A1 TaxID=2787717 RepID=UPI0018CB8B22